jgi:hypothetical protein
VETLDSQFLALLSIVDGLVFECDVVNFLDKCHSLVDDGLSGIDTNDQVFFGVSDEASSSTCGGRSSFLGLG